MVKKTQFRVIVSGGGVTGLALANCLEQAQVDYILLERRPDIAPQLGASIGIYPSAARILDQLGAYERLRDSTARVHWMANYHGNGDPIGKPSNLHDILLSRTGYELTWGDRQTLLEVLRDNIRDRSKILVNKQVTDIDHSPTGVRVLCKDGSSYDGDIIVGADGVYSKVREEMWRLAEAEVPDMVQSEKSALKADYSCLFGVAMVPMSWFKPGRFDFGIGRDKCIAVVPGKGNRVYYFVHERLKETCRLETLPSYTENDVNDFVLRNGHLRWKQDHTLANLWEKTSSFRLVPVEEAAFKMWTYGRIVCVGDSIHKATPHLAAGGNAAIESAAALANRIKLLADMSYVGSRPTEKRITHQLQGFQKEREARTTAMIEASNALSRVQTKHGVFDRLFVNYGLAHLADFLQEAAGELIVGAPKLDFLPIPSASLLGSQPFNPAQGLGAEESKLKRAIVAFPLLIVMVVVIITMDVSVAFPWAEQILAEDVVKVEGVSVPILKTFYRIEILDKLLALINTFLFPSIYNLDPVSRIQALSFMTDISVLVTIWQVEAVRRANRLTILQIPGIFAFVGQFVGLGIPAPLYAFLHYVLTPIETFSALDRRLTSLRYTRAIPYVVLSVYSGSLYGAYFYPDLTARQMWLSVLLIYPVWVAAVLYLLSRFFANTVEKDKIENPNRDLPYVKFTVGMPTLISAGVWVKTILLGSYGLAEVFVPRTLPMHTNNIGDASVESFRIDELAVFGSAMIWLAYLFGDMKRAGMTGVGWSRLVLYAVPIILAVGPGAALGLGWLWREEILATRRHKDARTMENLARLGEAVAEPKG